VLSRLKRAVVRVLGGQGQICVLRGEAGSGKTRIAHHVVQLMRTYGADAWIGSCPEGLGTPPLWIWQEVLRSARAVEGVPALRRLLGGSDSASPLVTAWLDEHDHAFAALTERERFRVHDALVRLLSAASRVRPKVIWLEDLHRADDAAWQVLRLLGPHLEHLPVLVLCTVRSRDDLTVALPVQRHVDDLARLSYCQRIHVPPLEADDTRALMTALLGAPPSDELCALVHGKSSGNPLFIREIVDAFAAHGGLDDVRALRGMAPPDAIRHVLTRRVERLGEDAARTLESMSVVANDVDVGLAAHLANLPVDALYGVLERAESARVLVRVPERVAGYRFAHSLMRETLYTELERNRRRKLHLAAADWLSQRSQAGVSEPAREIAHHLVHALPLADVRRTAECLMRAGDEAERTGALVDALRAHRSALEVGRNLGGLPEELVHALERAVARVERAMREERVSAAV
jgi:predicted ATPase